MLSNNINIYLKGAKVRMEDYAAGYGQALKEKVAMERVNKTWNRMWDLVAACFIFGLILFYGTANWKLAVGVALVAVLLVIVLTLHRVKQGLIEYDRAVSERAPEGPAIDQVEVDPTQDPAGPQNATGKFDEVYVGNGTCRTCKLPIDLMEMRAFGDDKPEIVRSWWEHEDTDVDEDHRAEPEVVVPTLGQIADVLRELKNKGVSYGSIEYAYERVWADDMEKDRQLRADLRRVFEKNAEEISAEVQKASDQSKDGFVMTTADGKIVPLNPSARFVSLHSDDIEPITKDDEDK